MNEWRRGEDEKEIEIEVEMEEKKETKTTQNFRHLKGPKEKKICLQRQSS